MNPAPSSPRAPRTPVAVPASPFTGKTLGRCRIGKPIGRGATATVFHADYLPLKKEVAVKILRPDAAASEEVRQRFIEEARALARLDHENVVRVFDVVEDQGFLLIIMDFVAGRNLRQAIEEDGPLDPATAVEYGRQIALALDHAHANRILHRDVKPGNIIVGEDGRAVLVDFGNAEAAGEEADRTGTAHYVAPEVFQGRRQDEKSDTYSLGATLYHMLTGEPPFGGRTVREILEAHEEGKVRAPSLVNPDAEIPKELDTLVKRSMASARGYRFAARDFASALEDAAGAVRAGPRKFRARTPRGRGGVVHSRTHGGLILGGALFVVGVVVVALVASGSRQEKLETPAQAPLVPPKRTAEAPPAEKAPAGPGIEKRAASRQAREEAAGKALLDAYDFASGNSDKPKAVADRFASVVADYADLDSGRKAKEEEKVWRDRALTWGERTSREAERKAEAERERKALEAALGKCTEAVGRMRFDEALAALQEVEPPEGKPDEWKRRQERLNNLIGFPDLVNEALRGSAVSVLEVRASFGKAGEKVVAADGEGLRLRSPSGERTVPWKDVKPAEVLALCRKVFRSSPEPRLALATYCWEAGLRTEAVKEIETTLLTDRTGIFAPRVEELFGDEARR